MLRRCLALILALGLPCAALAQTNPLRSNNNSTTITTGGTFQTLLTASGSGARRGCLIQNPTTATEVLYVFVGPTASATTATSFSIAAGASFSCATPQGVIQDNIAVEAATTSHAFIETDQ